MTSEKKIFQPVPSKNVCLIYELLHRDNLVSFPIAEEGKHRVEALIASINGEYFGKTNYPSSEERAVAYLYYLIKDHPFTDGNKRTACLTFEVVCELNNLAPDYSDFGLDALAIFIEKITQRDNHVVISVLSEMLFDSSGKSDKV